MIAATSSKRFAYLETARGVASIIVVFHHFLLGFYPALKGSVSEGGLRNTPLYLLVNGSEAVAFFFVLSGFVLTCKFYQRFSAPDLAESAIKRLPRLMLPAGLSMMIGAAILIHLPPVYETAARLTGSHWLGAFASAGISEGFVPSFSGAAQNSLFVFLWPHHYYQYNSNLWTMVYEFYGSLLVFVLVALCSLPLLRGRIQVVAVHALVTLLCLAIDKTEFVPFVVGSLISFLYCRQPSLFRLPSWALGVLLLAALIGYSVDDWALLVLASTATMILLLSVPVLEQRLSGPFGLFLGKLSFPLYLVHVLVMVSVTSATYVGLIEHGLDRGTVLAICLIVTLGASVVAAVPFMALEKLWVPTLNRWSRALTRKLTAGISPAAMGMDTTWRGRGR